VSHILSQMANITDICYSYEFTN